MRRVLLAGGAVALGDGMLLGTTVALGWTLLAVVTVVVGAAGAALVAVAVPAPRAPARGAMVTLGLPLREITTVVDPDDRAEPPVEARPGTDPDRARLSGVEPDTGQPAPAAA
ncbi:hypothetical protein [Isoptericola aurantiacus]|uniref:hypothetical protein n=1 Tax=Isoptericola aurantiacus TaxID=3377839 RepID=UPI00383AD2EF